MKQNIFAGLAIRKNNNLIQSLFLGILITIIACQTKEVRPPQYFDYWQTNSNQVSDTKNVNGIAMKLTYTPTDLLILNDVGNSLSKAEYDKIKSNFCEHMYFTLDVSSISEAKEVKKYFMHDRQKQFSLVCDMDTIPCIMYHPELSIGEESSLKLNLVFNRPNNQTCDSLFKKDVNVLFFDTSIASRQAIKFSIKGEKINQLTKIKI